MKNELWLHEQPSAKKWEGQSFDTVQHKLDGWRCTFFKQRSGQVLGFGKDRDRAGNQRRMDLEFISRFPRIAWDLKDEFAAMPAMTSIDLEIVTADASRSDVTTALRQTGTGRAKLNYIAFAVPFYDGQDHRNERMGTANAAANYMGFNFATWYETANLLAGYYIDLSKEEQVKDFLITRAKKLGIEGFMLKQGGQYGKWYKLKPEPTIDCVITGVVDGQGKYLNKVGALIVAVRNKETRRLIEIASCSGMTDAARDAMTSDHAKLKLIGRVVELKYQIVGTGGRLIHPRFVRFREDKLAHDCTSDQLKTGA